MPPDHECETTCDETNDEGAEWTCACLKRIDPSGGANELCGVPRYVAHAQKAFLWSTEATFLRHISLCG